MRARLRIGFIGWGAISRRAYELATSSGIEFSRLVVCLRADSNAGELPNGAVRVNAPSGLFGQELDMIFEAAGRDAVAEWGRAAMMNSRSFCVCSCSALTDDRLLRQLVATAEARGSKLLLPSGALAGIDGLSSARTLELEHVRHTITKHPNNWAGTPGFDSAEDCADGTPFTIFRGTARDAAQRFPRNANVVVITAFAGVGLDRTEVRLIADPSVRTNTHRIEANGAFGQMDVSISNEPLAANPRSSDMTALSLVRILRNRAASMALC